MEFLTSLSNPRVLIFFFFLVGLAPAAAMGFAHYGSLKYPRACRSFIWQDVDENGDLYSPCVLLVKLH